MTLTLLIIVIFVAIVFEFINGFHDSANAIATVVSTKALSPRTAVIYAGILNVMGSFVGTHVAQTIGKGIVETGVVTQMVILCALLAAIVWNLITWFYSLPSSSSHALIGGIMGATIAKAGFHSVKVHGVMTKVIVPMITSPVVGLVIGFCLTLLAMRVFYYSHPERINRHFKRYQIVSSGIMAFSHGSNDAQKTMGIITLALVSFGTLHTFEVPVWVIVTCALTMGLGTLMGGWKIIKTMGSKVVKLKPIHGFIAETSAASIILTASLFGIPISTTHVISTTIIGVGNAARSWEVKWTLVQKMVWAWVFTIPCSAGVSFLLYKLFDF